MRHFKVIAVTAWAVLAVPIYAFAVNNTQRPVSGNSAFLLSTQEVKLQVELASAGDCKAALRLSHYYSFIRNDFVEALQWLRLAGRCPDGNAKAELVYLLLEQPNQAQVANEINWLIVELKRIDATQARAVEQEVKSRRNVRP